MKAKVVLRRKFTSSSVSVGEKKAKSERSRHLSQEVRKNPSKINPKKANK